MNKFTYYPKVKSKDDSHLADSGEVVTFNKFEDSVTFIAKKAVSTATYKNNKRNNGNFQQTSLIMLDIDDSLSLQDASLRLKSLNLKSAIYTTASHQKEKHGKTCDRFRIVLQLDKEITNSDSYKATVKEAMRLFPEADKACKDPARYFLGNKDASLTFYEGSSMSTKNIQSWEGLVKRLNISEDIKGELKTFFRKAPSGLAGEWNVQLNKIVYILARCEVPQMDVLRTIEEVSPEPLDDRDLKTIQSGYQAGSKAGPYKIKEKESQVVLIEKFVESLNIKKTPKGMFISTQKFDVGELTNFVYVELLRKGFKVGQSVVESVMQNWYRLAKEDTSFAEEYFKQFRFKKGVTGEIDKAIAALSASNHELNRVALAHWIWQVKRKIFGLPVEYHLMLVFFGKTGSGKTVFINKLIDPIRPFVLPTDVSIVNDNREYHNFSENFIVFFDEMAHAARADVNKLKNIITCDTVSFRLLGKNSNVEHKNNSSFIGASNTELVDLIKDPTSARRYFQLNTLDKLDWQVVNDLNYERMFQEVDENAAPPIFAFMEELTKFQDETIRAKDSIEEWLGLEHVEFCHLQTEDGREISPNDLYAMYSEDQESQGKRMYHRKWYFFRKIKDYATQFRDADRRFYKLKIKNGAVKKNFLTIAMGNADQAG